MDAINLKQWKTQLALLILLLIITSLVYLPGLSGPYIFDDYPNIVYNKSIRINQLDIDSIKKASSYHDTSLPNRPLAFISLALNYYIAGGYDNVRAYKIGNLLIHLINTLLVYWLSVLLLNRINKDKDKGKSKIIHPEYIAVAIAALWALSPIQLTSVLYLVQRMTSMSAMAVFAGLIVFIYGRNALRHDALRGFGLMAIGLFFGTGIGYLCKENALLLPLFALLVEFLFFRRTALGAKTKRYLWIFYTLTILLPALVASIWILLHPHFIMSGYSVREFSLYQRLLTESRILWFYISLMLFPLYYRFGLFHDDFTISSGLLTPISTLPSLLAIVVLLIICLRYHKTWPMLAFAVLWYLLGHSMESTALPLELIHEHRNYVPAFGIIFGLVFGIHSLLVNTIQRRYLILTFAALITVVAANTFLRSSVWRDETTLLSTMVKNHPQSARSNILLAEYYAQKKNKPVYALHHYVKAVELDPKKSEYLLRIALTATQIKITIKGKVPTNYELYFGNLTKRVTPLLTIVRYRQHYHFTVKPEIITRISELLATRPVLNKTDQVFSELAYCLIHQKPRCGHLYKNIKQWLIIAIHNQLRMSDRTRQSLYITLVKILIANKEYKVALEYTQKARTQYPDKISLMLMQANVYYYLRDYANVHKLIETIKKRATSKNIAALTQLKILQGYLE